MNVLPENKNEQGHIDIHKTCTPSEEEDGAPEPVCVIPEGHMGAQPCHLVRVLTCPPENHCFSSYALMTAIFQFTGGAGGSDRQNLINFKIPSHHLFKPLSPAAACAPSESSQMAR